MKNALAQHRQIQGISGAWARLSACSVGDFMSSNSHIPDLTPRERLVVLADVKASVFGIVANCFTKVQYRGIG